ncbi:hypothetical protein ACFU99_05800 [Streptomyces sp. NPDC057654]|uniref:hypothetical protein n=1 Tax=Streptomyces sp. NPDC057654 TaxID=3346196 RepID=UPI00368A0E04
MRTNMKELREQAVEHLGWEKRDPKRYNLDGIIRDAWLNGDGSDETWKAAVEKHYRRFVIGDWVRVTVAVEDDFTEHHYGRITWFVKAGGGAYRGQPAKPHSACVELPHCPEWWGRLSELTPALDDFEIVREWEKIHRDSLNHRFHCLRCTSAYSYKSAEVMIVHKHSGLRVRLCEDCFDNEELASLGHDVLFHERGCRDTILELRANPELITGPRDGRSGVRSAGESYRYWADTFPWMVPATAAELYAQWQGARNAGAA